MIFQTHHTKEGEQGGSKRPFFASCARSSRRSGYRGTRLGNRGMLELRNALGGACGSKPR
jgi:hypothetical protein